MFKGKKVLALIPARGGSKGIKDKNIIDLNGKPLIAYTIMAAKKSKYIDDVVVTTDSERIADVSKKYGASVPFLRPKELASDTAKTIDAVIHAINFLKTYGTSYDILILLQPTQPLRSTEEIDSALEYFDKKGSRGLASVSLVDDHPILIRTIDQDGELTSILGEKSTVRRQDMPNYYRINGCIYINSICEINDETSFNDNPIGYIMLNEHSVDIDELKDLVVAKYYIENN